MKRKVTITESDLISKIEKAVLNEQTMAWHCEGGGAPGAPCQCVPSYITQIPPGVPTYPTAQDCLSDTNTCCGGNPPQTFGCVNGQCQAVPNGPFMTLQDCYGQCTPAQWWCIGGVAGMGCIQSPHHPGPNANGPFVSQQDCNNQCGSQQLTWKCQATNNNPKFGSQCVQVQPGQGDFATKQDCQNSPGCAQLHINKEPNFDTTDDVNVDVTMDVSPKKQPVTDKARARARALNEAALNVINEQLSNCQHCDCFFDMTWSQGHQYGGHVEIEGCMQPAGGQLTIYVNNSMQLQTSSLTGTFGGPLQWGNAQTPIIRVKAVMECDGTNPACSAQDVQKTICVKRSNGQQVSCSKRLPQGDLLKHGGEKAGAVNVTNTGLDSRDDAEDIREYDAKRLISKVINENKICRCMGQTWYGHNGPIMCNTAQYGVQAWWAEDCCNKTMETPEGCWVSSNVAPPGGLDKTKGAADAELEVDTMGDDYMGDDIDVSVEMNESNFNRIVNKVINEGGKYPDNRFGICLCPPPWSPCGCLGEAMSRGIAPQDMDPADFTGNDAAVPGYEVERPDLMHQKNK